MKIIISENKIEKLNQLIKDLGVEQAVQLMGGIKTLATVLGYDSVPGYIYQYLSEKYYPDYNWEHKDYYQDEVERYGSFSFVVNDRNAYDYFTYDDTESSKLDIAGWVYNDLDELFDGYEWKDTFKKWFQDKTGLKVGWVE
jgi:hypothetical protein